MKYIKKIPAANEEISEKLKNAGWKRLKEPKNVAMATLCALPIAFLLGGIVIIIARWLNPSLFGFLQDGAFGISIGITLMTLVYIIMIFAFMLLHEFIHAVFVPGFIKSNNVFWGFNGAFGFVYTTQPIKKGRFIVISFMPLVLLSFALPFALHLLGWLNGYTTFLCCLNALGSCVDVLNIGLVAVQVPNGYTLINNGYDTYYKCVTPAPLA